MPAPKPRLILADDYSDLLVEIINLLSKDFAVVATAHDGVELVAAAAKYEPDVVVTDAAMPRLSGLEASREILRRKLCPAIVLLTVHNERELIDAAIQAGIRGYVLKVNAGEDLALAVHEALLGRVFISRNIRGP
jgi:DNA-binding NarL/FixJ family response regulator